MVVYKQEKECLQGNCLASYISPNSLALYYQDYLLAFFFNSAFSRAMYIAIDIYLMLYQYVLLW